MTRRSREADILPCFANMDISLENPNMNDIERDIDSVSERSFGPNGRKIGETNS